jgi:ABC-type multidrug transport system ATPase subunit
MAEVRLEGISKSFGDTQAIQGLDLTIHDGEFFVLLGPTGMGKTTTLRLRGSRSPILDVCLSAVKMPPIGIQRLET